LSGKGHRPKIYPSKVGMPQRANKASGVKFQHLLDRTPEQKRADHEKRKETRKALHPSPTRKKDLVGHRLQIIEETTERIRHAMHSEGVNQTELARRLDMTPGHVSHMMSGTRNMTLATLADIAHALGYEFTIVPVKKVSINGRSNPSSGEDNSTAHTESAV
jgi:ribosome-binding protein aMBF1 (putative translation factor)